MASKSIQRQMTVDFNVYDSDNKLMGVASVTLPTLEWISSTMNGAGIAGNVEVVARGMMEAMTLGMNFRMVTKEAVALSGPDRHKITLRNAEQYEDPVYGLIGIERVKHVFVVMPKNMNFGSIGQATTHDGSGQYAVRYWAMYIGQENVLNIDQLSGRCIIGGKDYRADINAAI